MANTDNKNNKKFSLRKLIYNDKYLIVFSIITAVIVWISTSMSLSPETTKTITVPVNVDFSNTAADQLGIKCYGDTKIDVDVTVNCKKYLARDISADDLKVQLQTNAVTSKGNYEVPITVSSVNENADFNISSYYPTVYKAYFDVEDEKTLDIDLTYTNDDFVADGYVMGETLLSEKVAKVKGPKSYVSKVKKLVANVDIENKLKSTQSIDITAVPVDANGNAVDYVSVDTDSKNLTVTIPVLKEMTLNVTSSFTGKPYGVDESKFDVSYSVNKVSSAVLEDSGIKDANIGNIDFSQLNVGKNTIKFDVTTLDGIVILDDVKEITVTVNVPSTYKTKRIAVNKDSVTVTNVPDGYKANVISVNSKEVTVIGSKSNLNNDKTGVGMVVDLSSYKSDDISLGRDYYDITPNIENSSGCWVYGDYKAQIELVKK